MKLKLVSDFTDYYDHWFDRKGWEFVRKTNEGMSREDMLRFLRTKDYNVPSFGHTLQPEDGYTLKPENLRMYQLGMYQNPEKVPVVVHIEDKHQGQGKLLMELQKANRSYPDKLKVEYLPQFPNQDISKSYRLLQIGNLQFNLEYISQNDWRSNNGKVKINLLNKVPRVIKNPKIDYPLYAIDFVFNFDTMYGIDYNIAPQIRGTGIENVLEGRKIVKEIKKWFKNQY